MWIITKEVEILVFTDNHLGKRSNKITIIPSATNAIAVPIKSVLTELRREDAIKLFTSIELAGNQDCIMPKAANTLDCVITMGYSPRTTDRTCFHAGSSRLPRSTPD